MSLVHFKKRLCRWIDLRVKAPIRGGSIVAKPEEWEFVRFTETQGIRSDREKPTLRRRLWPERADKYLSS